MEYFFSCRKIEKEFSFFFLSGDNKKLLVTLVNIFFHNNEKICFKTINFFPGILLFQFNGYDDDDYHHYR